MRDQTGPGLAGQAAQARLVGQVVGFTRWVGAGRRLTQRGRLTLADARELVVALDTGDEIDPRIGARVFRTRSSEELAALTVVVELSKALRLVRVSGGRLVAVKKNAGLLEDPLGLLTGVLSEIGTVGRALVPARASGNSMMRGALERTAAAILRLLYGRGQVPLDELQQLAWDTASVMFVLDAPEQTLRRWRSSNDRDACRFVQALQMLGVAQVAGESVELTELGRYVIARWRGEPLPGALLFQMKITLAEVADPPVWRRVLVPAGITLERLHEVIQAAMG